MIDHQIPFRLRRVNFSRLFRDAALHVLSWMGAIACGAGIASAADLTFNISAVSAWDDPLPPGTHGFTYADVWTDGTYAYVGSDRSGQGMSIFDITNPADPIYLTTYAGSEMEDVEVWDGIGYFGSDVTTSPSGTGVDILDLSIPFSPVLLSRVDEQDCISLGVCGHSKVHTLSVSEGYLYTADNATDVIKIFDVTDPENPQMAANLDINTPGGQNSHEVVVRNDRLYIASKTGSSGYAHIYDVSNPANPVLLKAFPSGPASHTATPSDDGNLLIVAEERINGKVQIYDISALDEPGSPPLLKEINRADFGIDGHTPHHPHMYGNLLFVTWYEAGLQVFNISDPTNPIHVGAFDTFIGGPPSGPTTGCAVSGSANCSGNWGVDISLGLDRVLLSDRQRGLIVVDASGVLAAGDYNHDGIVDGDDYTVWRSTFGETAGGLHHGPVADGNNDDIVDAADYLIWRKNLGQMGPGGLGAGSSPIGYRAVPEPSTICLVFGTAIIAMLPRRCVNARSAPQRA